MTAARRVTAAARIALFPGYRQARPGTRPPRSKDNRKNMNDTDDASDRMASPRSRAGRRRRAGALAAALAGTALLAAACSGTPAETDTFAPGATYAQTLAFAKCMRANGVPNFPDPDRQGNFNNATIQALENNGSQERNALHQCRSVLPNADTGLTVTQVQQIQEQNLRNAVQGARCMRTHGITNFPDPVGTTQASGVNWQPVISAIQAGLNTSTPSYEAAFLACNSGKVDGGIIPPDLAPGQAPDVFPSGPPPGSPPPVSGNGS
jgi:hypothetical protein